MKKLMTAFAACMLAGFVSAQITSLNIVGYTTSVIPGAMVYTPMFTQVGGTASTLGDIQGNFEDFDTIQILDASLAATTIYTWGSVGGPNSVWSSDGVTDDSNVVIARGAGVVVTTTSSTLLNAGEVAPGTTVVNCLAGSTVLGNPVPKNITLGSIVFSDLADFDTIQILGPDLAATTIYTWGSVGGPNSVWSSDGVTDDSGVVLAPGDGFVLSNASDCSVTFPAAL